MAPAGFFFEPTDLPRIVTLLRERLPTEARQIVQEADLISRHRFDLLGFTNLDYGSEIDWHLDPVHGKRAPRKAWYKIPYLDFGTVGDHKIIWELNRHQHLVALAKAYCLTQEERFASELVRQWYHWRQENPYPVGINWASNLEVAFRSLSWLWVRHLLAACPAVPESFFLDLQQAQALNGRHIERYLSTYFSPNTHLLGEGVALFFLGTLYPQFRAAPRWRARGWTVVLRQAARQVRPDGMHFEQSTYYHVYALDFFLHARTLAARHGIQIPSAFDQTLVKMLELLAALSQAGAPPRLGDDDGGRLFNPRRNRAEHMVDPLTTGAVVFGRGNFKSVSGRLCEESLWLLGPSGIDQFDALPSPKLPISSVGFQASGIYVMATSAPAPQQLVIDAGPQGAGNSGHGHADALSVQLRHGAHEWLADPGTFCYVSGGNERDLFRGTAAHNTLRVDGLNQADPAEPFAWNSLPKVRAECWSTGKTFDLFAGSHTGYCRLDDPVVHQRWVFRLNSRFWLVRDLASGAGSHRIDVPWHLAAGFVPTDMSGSTRFVTAQEGTGRTEVLAFLPVEGDGWCQEITRGAVSPVYGASEPACVLCFSKTATLPVEFALLLLPRTRACEELGVLARVEERAADAPVRGYRYEVQGERHTMFFGERGRSWISGPWASDAEFLYCGAAPDGSRHLIVCAGSYLEFSRQQAVALKRPVERLEWVSGRAGSEVMCSDQSALEKFGLSILD